MDIGRLLEVNRGTITINEWAGEIREVGRGTEGYEYFPAS